MDIHALRTTYAGLDATVDALISIGFVIDRNAPRPGSLITGIPRISLLSFPKEN